MNIAHKEACSEVLDILNYMRKEDVEKISPEFMRYLKSNALKNYVSKLDHTMKIKDMNLKPRTKAILAIIYIKFWSTPKGKVDFYEKLKRNEINYRMNKQE